MFLGQHVKRMSGRSNIRIWMGECHVHAGIDPEDIRLKRAEHPGAEFLIHPECGCSTSVLEAMSAGEIDPTGVQILSTEGMIKRPALSRTTSSSSRPRSGSCIGCGARIRRSGSSRRTTARCART